MFPIRYNSKTYKDYIPNSIFYRKPSKNDEFKTIENIINSNGIRGLEIKSKNKTRVLNIGDSFIQAEEIEFDSTFTELLNVRYKGKMEFISHGISSWSPTPIFSWIYHNENKIKFDEVNMFLCINDFYSPESKYSDYNYRKQSYYIENVPVKYRLKTKDKLRNITNVLSRFEIFRTLILFYKFIININDKGKVNLNSNSLYELKKLEKNEKYWTPKEKKNIDNTIDVIKAIALFLKKKEINLCVYMVPSAFCWKDECLIGKKSYGINKEDFISQKEFDNYLKKNLTKSGIKCITLFDFFNKYKNENPNLKLYLQSDGHWNNKGHKLVCQIISNEFNQSHYLNKSKDFKPNN